MIAAIALRRILGIGTMLVTLYAAMPAAAHRATERYIPLGQSPGVSHTFTVVGKIEAVDQGRRTVTVATPSGRLVVQIRKETNIWVDRTKQKQTSLDGAFIDLKSGRTIEVKFIDPDRKQVVDWVKVEAPLLP
ncbi:MAG: hypothetical protein O3C34_18210 [Proteobacteria bacterium]|nr:hypothetical protein [Pseudomonadota bacterium]